MRRNLIALAAAVGLVAIASEARSDPPAAGAAPEQTPVQAYRHVMMEAAARHMKATGMIVKAKVDRRRDLVAHATALHDIAATMTELFPQGSGPEAGHTEAKAEIWTRWDDFTAAATAFEAESAKLIEAAKGDDFDAFKAQFGKVGQTCGDCHDAFTEEEEDGH